jgi:hypothetical protein
MAGRSRWACPTEDALFRFSTGDLSRWQRARVARHVEGCDACSAHLDGWETATAAYRQYVDDSTEHVSLTRFQARLRREPLLTPPAPPVRLASLALPRQVLTPFGWRSIAAALVLVAGALFGFLPLQQTITADALVARAVANDRQCPCPRAEMVTVAASTHRGKGQVVSTSVSTSDRADAQPSRGLMSERGAHARELAERLAEYAFDWQVPLSARPYQHWRSTIANRNDSYDWIGSDRVRVSTHATGGRIERAELILRATDFRPVGQTWLFADGFAVELRLFERDVPAAPSLVPPALNRVAAEIVRASAAPDARTIDETEIALRLSLERAGIVLTRRLTIGQKGERVAIAGRAAPRDVRRISASARDIGGIIVDVRADTGRTARQPVAAAAEAIDASGSHLPSVGSKGFSAWLDRTFDTSESRATFLPAARRLCDDFDDAVVALDALSRRFLPTAAADARLSTHARNDARWLTAAYYARVAASYERLENHLAPLTGSVSRRVLAATPPSHWRTMVTAITPATRALSQELDVLASMDGANADDFERTAGEHLRARLVAVVPR